MHFKLGDVVFSMLYGKITKGTIIGVSFVKYNFDYVPVITQETIVRQLGERGEYYVVYFEKFFDTRIINYTDLFSSVENLVEYITR